MAAGSKYRSEAASTPADVSVIFREVTKMGGVRKSDTGKPGANERTDGRAPSAPHETDSTCCNWPTNEKVCATSSTT